MFAIKQLLSTPGIQYTPVDLKSPLPKKIEDNEVKILFSDGEAALYDKNILLSKLDFFNRLLSKLKGD